jgi:hypothetical protein
MIAKKGFFLRVQILFTLFMHKLDPPQSSVISMLRQNLDNVWRFIPDAREK